MSVVSTQGFYNEPKIFSRAFSAKAGVGCAYLGRRLRCAQPLPQAKMLLAYSQRSLRPKYSTDKQPILNFASILQGKPPRLRFH